jgi:hypothetical protein
MRAGDLTAEYIGQTVTVEDDYGPGGKMSATGELIEVSHGHSTMQVIDGKISTVRSTIIRLRFTNTQLAKITVHSDAEVGPGA